MTKPDKLVRALVAGWLQWVKVLATASAFTVNATLANDYWGSSLDTSWQTYLQQSAQASQTLAQALSDELANAKRTAPIPAIKAKNFGLNAIGDPHELRAVISYQTVLGGWSKRTDMRLPRQLGQLAGSEVEYIPTFDNGATSTQIRWLAAYYPQATAADQALIRAAVVRAVQYLLQAQYPNGGFPQSYPLRGGYHDAITLNDQVLTDLLRLLWDIGHDEQFAWLDARLRAHAASAFELGVAWLLQAQVRIDGVRTVWAAQYHPLTAQPVAARKFEQVSLVSTESAAALQLLLDHGLSAPGAVEAVCAGAAWLSQHAIRDQKWQRTAQGSQLVPKVGAISWARFYSVPAQQPVFFDRDGQRYSDVSQLSLERQHGYGWYQSDAKGFLQAFQRRTDLVAQCSRIDRAVAPASR